MLFLDFLQEKSTHLADCNSSACVNYLTFLLLPLISKLNNIIKKHYIVIGILVAMKMAEVPEWFTIVRITFVYIIEEYFS